MVLLPVRSRTFIVYLLNTCDCSTVDCTCCLYKLKVNQQELGLVDLLKEAFEFISSCSHNIFCIFPYSKNGMLNIQLSMVSILLCGFLSTSVWKCTWKLCLYWCRNVIHRVVDLEWDGHHHGDIAKTGQLCSQYLQSGVLLNRLSGIFLK